MLGKLSSLIHLFGVVVIIVPIQSNGQSPPYRNYYDGRANELNLLSTFLQFGSGVLNFLEQGQREFNEEVPDRTPPSGAVYDFVVVGAGTAGATLAARLSEIPQAKVLLIEAGSRENLFMNIPLLAFYQQLSDEINWKYRTKPTDKYCRAGGGVCNVPRGKVMGGSSVLNLMIATRGNAEDYDRWAEMGNDGWAYEDVLKYFKKMETIDIPELRSDTTYHGTEGPLHIAHPSFRTPLAEAFLKAGAELGYPLTDYNRRDTIGFSYLQATIMNGTRMSSNRAYLRPARARRNLHVSRDSTARRVLIDGRARRAVGVEFAKRGRLVTAFASKEVILCAGAIGSPQLLMLSGVGPAEHLAEHGIRVVRDAPGVGENLMDHVSYLGLIWSVDAPASIIFSDLTAPSYLTDFLTRRSGPYTVPAMCEALAFIDTKRPEKRTGLPDIELLFLGYGISGDPIATAVVDPDTPLRQIWASRQNYHGWTVIPLLLKPKSRGRIRLLGNNVDVKPEIVPNYYDDPEDVDTVIAGIKATFDVSRTKAMQAYGSRFLNISAPECASHEYDSRAYWECNARSMSFSIYHYSGTCKMGPRSDPTAVVDPALKVIGVRGLRVADASIMPEVISAHTNIPVYMIAEKAADMIKEEWGYLKKSES